MGLFNYHSRYDDDLAVAPGAKDGKIYKAVQLTTISIIIVAIALFVLELFRLFSFSLNTNGIILSIGVVGFGGMMALPWVRVFESYKDNNKIKITSIVFLAVIGVCILLWIVCLWQVIGLIRNLTSDMNDSAMKNVINSLNVIRVSIIVSLQFFIGSSITMNVIKYRKTLLPYQVMSGLSLLYIDFFCVLVLIAVTITESGIDLNPASTLLTNRWTFALLFIFILLNIFPSVVFRRADRRKLLAAKSADLKEMLSENAPAQAPKTTNPSAQEKLQNIKKLLDDGLITQEEYDAKRADILKDL